MKRERHKSYLHSDHWRNFTKRWKQSSLPKRCLGCLSPKDITLRHVTYVRLDHEYLNDVAPFCPSCLKKLEDVEITGGWTGLKEVLTETFGIDPRDAMARVKPFLDFKRDAISVEGRQRRTYLSRKRRNELKSAMQRDRKFHERMCDR